MSPEDKKALVGTFTEISKSFSRMEGERTYVKEAIKAASDKYSIDKKTLRKMAKTYHRKDFKEAVAAEEEYQTRYEEVTGEKATDE